MLLVVLCVHQCTSTIKWSVCVCVELIQQQRRADDRKANMMIFNVVDEVDGKFPQYGRDVWSQRGYWDR